MTGKWGKGNVWGLSRQSNQKWRGWFWRHFKELPRICRETPALLTNVESAPEEYFQESGAHLEVCVGIFAWVAKGGFPNNSPYIENLLLAMCMIPIITETTFSTLFRKEATSSWKSLCKLFSSLRRCTEAQRLAEWGVLFYLHPEFYWMAPEIYLRAMARTELNWLQPHPTTLFQSNCSANPFYKLAQCCSWLTFMSLPHYLTQMFRDCPFKASLSIFYLHLFGNIDA